MHQLQRLLQKRAIPEKPAAPGLAQTASPLRMKMVMLTRTMEHLSDLRKADVCQSLLLSRRLVKQACGDHP